MFYIVHLCTYYLDKNSTNGHVNQTQCFSIIFKTLTQNPYVKQPRYDRASFHLKTESSKDLTIFIHNGC